MKTGVKTTIFAIFGAALFIATLIMLFLGKITTEEFNIAAISIMSITTFLIGLYAKDFNQSHTFGDLPPPDKEEK